MNIGFLSLSLSLSLLMQVLYLVEVLIMTFDLLTCVRSQGMVYQGTRSSFMGSGENEYLSQ